MIGFIKRLFGFKKEEESWNTENLHDFIVDYKKRNHRIDYKMKPDLWKK